MKKTAVEQFEAHLIEYGFDLSLHKFEIQTFKAMEKEQIKDAWFDGVTNWDSEKEVEDYIKETFESE